VIALADVTDVGEVEDLDVVVRRESLVLHQLPARVVEPGDPDGSFLMDMITAGDMPPEGEGDKVPEEEIALIRTWIEQGALNN